MYDLDTPEGMKNSIEWTQKLFDCVSDGATWAVPRSGMIIKINKQAKEAVIIEGYLPDESIKRVLREMGWTTK
jgi:hypothetical protein